jgi:hypothetical protein
MFVLAQHTLGRDGNEHAKVDTSVREVTCERAPEPVPGGSSTDQDRCRVNGPVRFGGSK